MRILAFVGVILLVQACGGRLGGNPCRRVRGRVLHLERVDPNAGVNVTKVSSSRATNTGASKPAPCLRGFHCASQGSTTISSRTSSRTGTGTTTPALAGYLSPDPLLLAPGYLYAQSAIGRTVHAYSYATNNPLNFLDPNGLAVTEEEATAIAASDAIKETVEKTQEKKEISASIEKVEITDNKTGKTTTEYHFTAPQVQPGATEGSSPLPPTGPDTAAVIHNHPGPDGNKPSFDDYRVATAGKKWTTYVVTFEGNLVKIQGGSGRMSQHDPKADNGKGEFKPVRYAPADLKRRR